MNLQTEKYEDQLKVWPREGRHILAQFDDEKVVVYQAYRPEIGLYAAQKGYFGGAFSYSRMSWIKTNFLWMMYRCGWAQKQDQEVVLAIHLKRAFFNDLLLKAYPSSNIHRVERTEWSKKVKSSDVRLQWDPDHTPYGGKRARKAIQLGLRNQFLQPFKGEAILAIENITDFVLRERQKVLNRELAELNIPLERCYPVSAQAKHNLGM